jgi:hypothetical protein
VIIDVQKFGSGIAFFIVCGGISKIILIIPECFTDKLPAPGAEEQPIFLFSHRNITVFGH